MNICFVDDNTTLLEYMKSHEELVHQKEGLYNKLWTAQAQYYV